MDCRALFLNITTSSTTLILPGSCLSCQIESLATTKVNFFYDFAMSNNLTNVCTFDVFFNEVHTTDVRVLHVRSITCSLSHVIYSGANLKRIFETYLSTKVAILPERRPNSNICWRNLFFFFSYDSVEECDGDRIGLKMMMEFLVSGIYRKMMDCILM